MEFQPAEELIQRIVLLQEYIITLQNANKIKSFELSMKENTIKQLNEEISKIKYSKNNREPIYRSSDSQAQLKMYIEICKKLEEEIRSLKLKLCEKEKTSDKILKSSRTRIKSSSFDYNKVNLSRTLPSKFQEQERDIKMPESPLNQQNKNPLFGCNRKLYPIVTMPTYPKQSEKTLTSQTQNIINFKEQSLYGSNKVFQICGTISFSNLNDAEINIPLQSTKFQNPFTPHLKLSYDHYNLPSFINK